MNAPSGDAWRPDANDPAQSPAARNELRDRLRASLGATYALQGELGGGGMARVFVAEEIALHRQVVVKVLPPETAAAVSAERFRREIQMAARLQHPHIVPLLTAGTAGDILYYTMPMVEGESLRTKLEREGELSVTETVRILREVADALAYAHARGLVHRDIKPDNVLISANHAVVTDFGVAKAVSAATVEATLTAVGIALGTPAYMAPEQAAGETDVDARADLYALGCTAYEMLCGRTPFSGSLRQVLAQHMSAPPQPIVTRRADVPAGVDELIMRLLAKDAADRPATATAVVDALDALGSRPAASHGKARVARLLGLSRRTTVGVAVVAAIGITALGLWERSHGARIVERRLVVAPFENLTGDPSLDNVGRIAADWLTQGLTQTESLSVVSSAMAAAALGDAKGSYAERVQRLASKTGAGLLVSGSVVRRRDSLLLDVQLTEARTGRIISTLDPASGPVADPMVAIEAVRERLLAELAAEASSVRRLLAGTRPPTYAAYVEYLRGLELILRHADNAGSIPYFERAIALDSTFTQPYLWLGSAFVSTGQYEAADSLVQRTRWLRPRLTPTDRYRFDWLEAAMRGDLEAALRAAQGSAARDSDGVWLSLVGFDAVYLLRPRLAIPALQLADSAMTAAGAGLQRVALSIALHEAGRYDEELATLERGRRAFPDNRNMLVQELSPLAGLRNGARAIALADTVLRGETDSVGPSLVGVLDGALEVRAHGDPRSAEEIARLALAWCSAHPMKQEPSIRAFRHGLAFFLLGGLDSAETYFARAQPDPWFQAPAYLAVTRFLRSHDRIAAAHTADSLGALDRRWMFGGNTFAQAAIIAHLGDSERATQLLRQAVARGQPMFAWHVSPVLDPLRRYPPFVALITPER